MILFFLQIFRDRLKSQGKGSLLFYEIRECLVTYQEMHPVFLTDRLFLEAIPSVVETFESSSGGETYPLPLGGVGGEMGIQLFLFGPVAQK